MTVAVDDARPALALLRDAVRGLVARRWPVEDAPALAGDADALRSLWREAAAMGLSGDCLPGGDGGLGATVVVLEECGRAACPLPLADAAVFAAVLAAAAPDPAAAAVLGAVARGEAVVATALGASGGEPGAGAVVITDGRVRGRVRHVEATAVMTHLLVAGEGALALVDAAAAAVSLTPGLAVPALADVTVDAPPLAVLPVDAAAASRVRAVAATCRLSRAAGAASRLLDLAVVHARERVQFGSPVGRFQAVQHRLADCLTLLDASRLLVERAAADHDALSPGFPYSAAAAQGFAPAALRRVARDAHHVLAGVGYIEEHEAPRHLRRVVADSLRHGGAPLARELLAAVALDG